eukprot:3940481-Rhodomonas_salina.6
MLLSAYARARRCPVLTWGLLLSAYVFAMRLTDLAYAATRIAISNGRTRYYRPTRLLRNVRY